MRALRVEQGSKTAHLDEVEVPSMGPHDVLIKVKSAVLAPDVFGIVASGRLAQAPTTLGHKVAGIVDKVGAAVNEVQVGERVRLDPNLSCGACKFCRTDRDHMCAECGVMGFFALGNFPKWERYHPGGMADYVRAPAANVDVLPDNISFDVGAKVHDLANAVRAFRNCDLSVGSTVLITAATGAMGTSCIKIAPYFGVSRLILVGRHHERLEAVTKLTSISCDLIGLDTLGDDWVESRALGRRVRQLVPSGVDAIIDYSPVGVDLWQVLDGLALNGTFIPMGGNWSVLPIPARVVALNCWRVYGTRNHSRGDSSTVMELLKQGGLNVDELITHEFSLHDIESAIAQLKDRSRPSWMLIVRP